MRLIPLIACRRPAYSVFPEGFEYKGSLYFRFTRCAYPPMTPDKANQAMRDTVSRQFWLRGIHDAIEELHAIGIAHLDIRLPNICYNQARSPVLIDLDRSSQIMLGENWAGFANKYASDMYQKPEGMPCSDYNLFKMDYKQLAIMILLIISNDEQQDYHRAPTNLSGSHQFCRSSI